MQPVKGHRIDIRVWGGLAVILAAVIGIVATATPVLISISATETAEAKQTALALSATALPTSTPAASVTSAPTWTPTLPAVSCRFQGFDDDATIQKLIQEEAIGTNARDLEIMQTIFAPNAIFQDKVSSKMWIGPVERYENDAFKNAIFKGVTHYGIQPVGAGVSGNTATYISGSRGSYSPVGSQQSFTFDNPSIPGTRYGSDHWTLKKDAAGCWSITNFDFNAGAVEFPVP